METGYRPKIKKTWDTFADIKKNFEKERFVFIRYGDGDMLLMAGWEGKEKNQFNTPQLKKELIEGFHIPDPEYMIGIQIGIGREPDDTLRESDAYVGILGGWLAGHEKKLKKILDKYSQRNLYFTATTLQYLAVYHQSEFVKFVEEYIRPKDVLFVGGKHLKDIGWFFGTNKFISTPSQQAYEKIDDIYNQITEHEITLLSAGHTSRIIAKRMWKDGFKSKIIDIGSLADGLLGIECRSWIEAAKNQLQQCPKITRQS